MIFWKPHSRSHSNPGVTAEPVPHVGVGWGEVQDTNFSTDFLPAVIECRHHSYVAVKILLYGLKHSLKKKKNILIIRGPHHLHKYPAVLRFPFPFFPPRPVLSFEAYPNVLISAIPDLLLTQVLILSFYPYCSTLDLESPAYYDDDDYYFNILVFKNCFIDIINSQNNPVK